MGSFCSKNILGTSPRNQNLTGESFVSQALRNDMILENISSYLSLGDLKKFRLVNRKWNRASLISIRKNCILHISNAGCVKRPGEMSWAKLQKIVMRKIELYKTLTQLISNSIFGFPCSNISIIWQVDIIESELSLSEKELFGDFFLAISGFVTKLELIVSAMECDYIREFYLPENIQFPNLKTLEMPKFPLLEYDKMAECFKHITQNAPQLNTLALQSLCALSISKCLETMTIQQATQISTLYLKFFKWDEHLSLFNQINFRLKKLWLSLGEDSESLSENITSILESQSECLEILCIEIERYYFLRYNKPYVTIKFPLMDNLKLLKFVIIHQCKFPELNYKQQFPKLTHLLVDCVAEDLGYVLNSKMEPSHTVHTLVLGVEKLDSDMISQAALVFPNIKKLKMLAMQEALQTAGNLMENLEELTLVVWQGHVSDLCEVLTGYTQSELERIAKLAKSGKKRLDKEPMRFLHDLKILRIQVKDKDVRITDILRKLGPLNLRFENIANSGMWNYEHILRIEPDISGVLGQRKRTKDKTTCG